MRYTFLLYRNESAMDNVTPEQMNEARAAFVGYIQALKDADIFLATDWLLPSSTATTITLRDGSRRIQDGPYADTKEQMGGYFAIEAPDLDTALEWAEKCPAARYGVVEVRASAMPA